MYTFIWIAALLLSFYAALTMKNTVIAISKLPGLGKLTAVAAFVGGIIACRSVIRTYGGDVLLVAFIFVAITTVLYLTNEISNYFFPTLTEKREERDDEEDTDEEGQDFENDSDYVTTENVLNQIDDVFRGSKWKAVRRLVKVIFFNDLPALLEFRYDLENHIEQVSDDGVTDEELRQLKKLHDLVTEGIRAARKDLAQAFLAVLSSLENAGSDESDRVRALLEESCKANAELLRAKTEWDETSDS